MKIEKFLNGKVVSLIFLIITFLDIIFEGGKHVLLYVILSSPLYFIYYSIVKYRPIGLHFYYSKIIENKVRELYKNNDQKYKLQFCLINGERKLYTIASHDYFEITSHNVEDLVYLGRGTIIKPKED